MANNAVNTPLPSSCVLNTINLSMAVASHIIDHRRTESRLMSSKKAPRARSSPAATSSPKPAILQDAGSFPIVGIGASAGGLDAFTRLLSHLPLQTGMAFVVIQHLAPTRSSLLSPLLAKATPMPVLEAADGMTVKPDHVYVIPPNVNMAIASGALHLTPRGNPHRLHLPVDLFFRSLARERGHRAIAVVLTGAGADGSQGLSDIKAAGGITFAQDEASAAYPSMPHNAIQTGHVDSVLPPEAIAQELTRLAPHAARRPAPSTPPPISPATQDDYQKIFTLLSDTCRVDFSAYRDTTIRRRIARRMALRKQDTLAQYARLVEQDPSEVHALYHEILINVTSFFRDPEVFHALQADIFPQILRDKAPNDPIRIWVPGCATGQEAYSLAMVLLELLGNRPKRPPIQIFGTDINDPAAINTARAGLYPLKIEAEVSSDRLDRFFNREATGYRISKPIREMCVFARQNVVADPPFSRLDLISCRNLLIYLSADLQKQVLPTFHYALSPGGFLVLGTSESVGRFTDLFELVSKRHAIYRRPSR